MKGIIAAAVTAGLVATFTVALPAVAHDGHDGKKDHKVRICHKGHMINVDRHAILAHKMHGDRLWRCRPQPCAISSNRHRHPSPCPTPTPTITPTPTPTPTVTATPTATATATPVGQPTVTPTPTPTQGLPGPPGPAGPAGPAAPVCVSNRVAKWRITVRKNVRVRIISTTFEGVHAPIIKKGRTPGGRRFFIVRINLAGLKHGVYAARVKYRFTRVPFATPFDPADFGRPASIVRRKVHLFRACYGNPKGGKGEGLNPYPVTLL